MSTIASGAAGRAGRRPTAPELLVQGPLIATLLLNLLRRQVPKSPVVHFELRSIEPIFDIAPFAAHGRRDGDRQVKLWAVTHEGHLAMDASATLA